MFCNSVQPHQPSQLIYNRSSSSCLIKPVFIFDCYLQSTFVLGPLLLYNSKEVFVVEATSARTSLLIA